MKKIVVIAMVVSFFSLVLAQDFYDINTINIVELTFEEDNWDDVLDNLYSAGDEERLV